MLKAASSQSLRCSEQYAAHATAIDHESRHEDAVVRFAARTFGSGALLPKSATQVVELCISVAAPDAAPI
jgi:hypothetical protein